MAKALMVQGTGSGTGKSLIVTALCRIFKDMGINVAPFKAQNMALNSFITKEGGEIGRAQALQAEAARIEPSIDMNPVLLKASGDAGCQVIIHGKLHSTMKATEYYEFKKTAWNAVKESFERLSQRFDLIVIEGAGSPAEINLMNVDIVNMSMARHAKAPVLLVGDINRGGVFASLYGTVKLLGHSSRFIKAFLINKFRGDIEILRPGLEMIKMKTGKPVIGVIPYIKDIRLSEEDGLCLHEGLYPSRSVPDSVKVVVVRIPYISNFTDFDPFIYEPDVELLYSINPSDIENADIVIVPGTKNTVKALHFLKEKQLDEVLKRAYKKGIPIIGICGGYQILGKRIYDHHGVESHQREIEGISLLNIETVFETKKITSQVEAEFNTSPFHPFTYSPAHFFLRGYEIHMGVSRGEIGLLRIKRCGGEEILDGSINGNCWGTYLHGIFDSDEFRRALINAVRKNKGLDPLDIKVRYHEIKDRQIDYLADIIRKNVDMDFIKSIIRL